MFGWLFGWWRGRGKGPWWARGQPWPGNGPWSHLPPWQRPGWIYGRGWCWRWWLGYYYGYPPAPWYWSWPPANWTGWWW